MLNDDYNDTMDEKRTQDSGGMLATKGKGGETPSEGGTVLHVSELPVFDQKATRKLLRKLDWHLLPFMSLIYL